METEFAYSTHCISNQFKAAVFIVILLIATGLLLASGWCLRLEVAKSKEWTLRIRILLLLLFYFLCQLVLLDLVLMSLS